MAEPLRSLETLQDDGEFFAFRTVRDGEPLIMVRMAGEPTSSGYAKLQNVLELGEALDREWAVRPRAIEDWRGRPTLVLDDPGGMPLARRLGRGWELTELLSVAIATAVALRELHARGIVHRDIKPSHLLLAPTGDVRLLGFGIAMRSLPRGAAPRADGIATGTLAYMAPEQTGRLDRPVDARADLYALGVTLYELSTGALPFNATSASEWIHAHVAREPPFIGNVPTMVAAIILKLLAKSPEDRYQTAAGLEADLRRCYFEWKAHGVIERFELGEHDSVDRLLLRDRLYGREGPIEVLRAALDRLVERGSTDDLQWADPATIELLGEVSSSSQSLHLLVIGAYCDAAESPDTPPVAVDAIRAGGVVVQTIHLGPLAVEGIVRLVADTLRCGTARARPIAEVAHAKTGGNPFFATHFLRALADERVLVFDRAGASWQWDDALLAEPIAAGLVVRRGDRYAFVHGRVKEAAYALSPPREREPIHVEVGRVLLARAGNAELGAGIFDIAEQLVHGLGLIDDVDERLRFADCEASCFAYSEARLVLGPAFGDHRAGYRFGRMGLELVDRGCARHRAAEPRPGLEGLGHRRWRCHSPPVLVRARWGRAAQLSAVRQRPGWRANGTARDDGRPAAKRQMKGRRTMVTEHHLSPRAVRAHAFKNSLGVVSATNRLIQSELSDAGRERLERSQDAVRRMLSLIEEDLSPDPVYVVDDDPRRGSVVLSFPPFHLDPREERLWEGGKELHVRRKPFAILRYLAEHARRLITQKELVEAVWGKVAMSDSLLRSHIRAVRQVVGAGIIETVLGRGYRFLPEVRATQASSLPHVPVPGASRAGR